MLNRILSGLGSLWSNLAGTVPQALTAQAVGVSFVPNVFPDFPPLHAILKRDGEPFPVIVEGADIAYARRVLEGDLLKEFENFLSSTPPFDAVPWICLVRDLEGQVEGMALSWLVGRGPGMQMKCERDRKRILSGEGNIENVGIVLLVAKLRWMKARGCWSYGREILTNYDPQVMASYRRRCGLEKGFFDDLTISTVSVSRGDGETFLAQRLIPIQSLR